MTNLFLEDFVNELSAFLWATLGVLGCDDETVCTQRGCDEAGVVLTLEVSDHLESGLHEITMTASDGEAFVCDLLVESSDNRLTIGPSSCSAPDAFISSSGGFDGIDELVMTTPLLGDEVTITVTRDDVELLSEIVEPSYERNEPNGPGCAPVCESAEIRREI